MNAPGSTPIWNNVPVKAASTGVSGSVLISTNNLSDVQSAVQSRINLGLGTAALSGVGDFDSVGSAAAALRTAEA